MVRLDSLYCPFCTFTADADFLLPSCSSYGSGRLILRSQRDGRNDNPYATALSRQGLVKEATRTFRTLNPLHSSEDKISVCRPFGTFSPSFAVVETIVLEGRKEIQPSEKLESRMSTSLVFRGTSTATEQEQLQSVNTPFSWSVGLIAPHCTDSPGARKNAF